MMGDIISNSIDLEPMKMALLDLKQHFKDSKENFLIMDTHKEQLHYRIVEATDSIEVPHNLL